jgi:hypothetical protein
MITVELSGLVARTPYPDPRDPYRTRFELERIDSGSPHWSRCVYVPTVALVILEHRSGYLAMIPVERVEHMTTDHRTPTIEQLEQVIP